MFKKLITSLAAAAITCMLSVAAFAGTDPVYFTKNCDFVVSPTEKSNITGSETWYLTTDPECIWDTEHDITITNLKSSNRKVAKVSVPSYANYMIHIDYRNVCGSTTISFTANGQNFSRVFKVRYTCPISKFKVDKTNATTKLKKKNLYTSSKTVKNKKAMIKAKKGWIIDSVTTTCSNKPLRTKTKSIKVNKASWSGKVSFNTPYDGIVATLHNLKTNEEQTVTYQLGMVSGFSHEAG